MTNLISIKLESGENIVGEVIEEVTENYIEVNNPVQFIMDSYGNIMMKKWIPGLTDNVIRIAKSKIVASSNHVSEKQKDYYFDYLQAEFEDAFEADSTTMIRSNYVN